MRALIVAACAASLVACSTAPPRPDGTRSAQVENKRDSFCTRHVDLCLWLGVVVAVTAVILLKPHKAGPPACTDCPNDPKPPPTDLPFCSFPPGKYEIPWFNCREY